MLLRAILLSITLDLDLDNHYAIAIALAYNAANTHAQESDLAR